MTAVQSIRTTPNGLNWLKPLIGSCCTDTQANRPNRAEMLKHHPAVEISYHPASSIVQHLVVNRRPRLRLPPRLRHRLLHGAMCQT